MGGRDPNPTIIRIADAYESRNACASKDLKHVLEIYERAANIASNWQFAALAGILY
jgi:hypothetical protein